MARRRKSSSAKPKKIKTVDEQPIVANQQMPFALGAPNHRVSPLSTWRKPFPMCEITDEDGVPIFTNPDYGKPYCDYQAAEGAPTWIDPMLFAKLCKERADIQAILQEAVEKDRLAPAVKKLVSLMDDVFDNDYLPATMNLFSRSKAYIAEWLVFNHAAKQCGAKADAYYLQEQHKSRRRKKIKIDDSADALPAEIDDFSMAQTE